MSVPLLDLRRQYAPLKAQFLAAIEAVTDSQFLILGPHTESFEKAVADYVGVPHAIACSSGTDAQLLLLMALDITAGDIVITSPYTFFATAGCVARLGARPVFVDIDPSTFNLSIPALTLALSQYPQAKAIIPVHLFGQCADMDAILHLARPLGIPVLEDAAQALGTRHPLGAAGSIGEAGWFSFYPTKNLGAFGDAGMVVCHSDSLASKMRALRNHGMEPRYFHSLIGGNFRIDAIQSAILQIKLPHLDRWSEGRRQRAAFYRRAIDNAGLSPFLSLPFEQFAHTQTPNHHIYNQFIIRTPHRNALRAHLTKLEIGTEIYYPRPLHEQVCFASLGYQSGDFPEAERASRESLALPIFPELTEDEQSEVVRGLTSFFSSI